MRRIFIAALLAVALAAGCTFLPTPFQSQMPPVVEPTPGSTIAPPSDLNPGLAQSPVPARADSATAGGQPPAKAAQVGAPTPGSAARQRQRIILNAPQNGAMLVNGTTVRGAVLAVPADKTLTYRVYDDRGRVIGRGPIAVIGDYGGAGTFEGIVNFAASPNGGSGQLEILDSSSPDGSVVDSAWINVGFGRRLAPFRGRIATISPNGIEPGSKFHNGDELQGGVTLTPPESHLVYRVYDLNGNLIGSGTIKVQGEPGGSGRFRAPITFKVAMVDAGRILIIDQSTVDGRILSRAALNVMLAPIDRTAAGAAPAPGSQASPVPPPPPGGPDTTGGDEAPTPGEPETPGLAPPGPSPTMTGTLANRTFMPGILSRQGGETEAPEVREPPTVTLHADLAEHTWYLKALDGQPLVQGSMIVMQLSEQGELTGFAGCNRYFSQYQVAEKAMQMDPPGAGRNVCGLPAGVMAQENDYLFALAAVERYRLEGGELQLFTDGDLPALIFTGAQ